MKKLKARYNKFKSIADCRRILSIKIRIKTIKFALEYCIIIWNWSIWYKSKQRKSWNYEEC